MLPRPPPVPHHHPPKANRQGLIVERQRSFCLVKRTLASWLRHGKGIRSDKVPEKSRQILFSPPVLMAVEDAVKIEQWRVEGDQAAFRLHAINFLRKE
jgi:hypothetical protein